MMVQGVRAELAHDNIHVAGVFTAGVDTRMGAKNNHPKISPVEHARDVFKAVSDGAEDIYAGAGAEDMRAAYEADPKAFERRRIERFYTDPLP